MKRYSMKALSFRARILLFFIPFIALLLVGGALISYQYSFAVQKADKEQSTKVLIDQLGLNFDYYFQDIKATIAYFGVNADIQRAMTEYDTLSIQEKYFLDDRIANFTSHYNIFKNHINDILIIGLNGYLDNLESYYRLSNASSLLNKPWIEEYTVAADSYYTFTKPHPADYYDSISTNHMVVSVLLPIKIKNGIRNIGYIQADIDHEKMSNMLASVYRQNDIDMTMMTEDGVIVFNRDPKTINKWMESQLFRQVTKRENATFTYSTAEGDFLVVCRRSPVTGWYLVASTPYSVLLASSDAILKITLFVILPLSLMAAVLIILLLAGQIKKPLNRLVARVENTNVEKFVPINSDYHVAEFNLLGDKFENQFMQINQLIQDVYLAEIKKKNAEFETLRGQITPHFLYNSLQLIKAEAVTAHNREISTIVTRLANLLRYTMDTATSEVSVRDEVAYIVDYLDLYKRRYVDKFEYSIEVDPDLLCLPIMKLMLQPLVENCIKHGFEQKEHDGLICVKGWMEGNDIAFEVYDNGCGISAEQCENIMELFGNANMPAHGIGLFNVHQRLRIRYGESSGIRQIESQKGCFTSVILHICMEEKKDV